MQNKLSSLDRLAQRKLGPTFSAHARGGVTLMAPMASSWMRAADKQMAANNPQAPALRAA